MPDIRTQFRRDKFDLVVSYSMIRTWRLCRQQFTYKYIDKLEPRIKDVRLVMGDYCHQLTEAHARGQNWRAVVEKWEEQHEKLFEEEQEALGVDLPAVGEKIMEGYIRRWKNAPLTYEMVERSIGPMTLVEPTERRPIHIGITIKPDGVIKDEEGFWLLERKTAKNFGDLGLRLYDLQSAIYLWALQQEGYEMEGILWDEIRSKAPMVPHLLVRGGLSKAQKIDTDWPTFLREIRRHELDPKDYHMIKARLKKDRNRFYRRQYFPIKQVLVDNLMADARTTALEIWRFMNQPVRNIAFMCRFCDFQRLCEAELMDIDTDFMRKSDFKKRKRRGEKKKKV